MLDINISGSAGLSDPGRACRKLDFSSVDDHRVALTRVVAEGVAIGVRAPGYRRTRHTCRMLCRMKSFAMRRLFVCVFTGAILWAADSRSSGAAAVQGAEPPTVDFMAVAADGRPVADLKAEDVSLKVGGRNRAVKALRLVRYAGGGPAAATSALPAPFATNADGGGGGSATRSILIVVEDESLRPGAERDLRDQVTKFLDALSEGDRVGLATAPRDVARVGLGPASRVREALAQITGRQPGSMTDAERLCRTRDTLVALRSQLAALAGAETPTTLIVFSSALSTPASPRAAGATSRRTTIRRWDRRPRRRGQTSMSCSRIRTSRSGMTASRISPA